MTKLLPPANEVAGRECFQRAFTGGGAGEGACVAGGHAWQGVCAWLGGGGVMHGWGEACMVGGVHGGGMHGWGACMAGHTPI